VVLAAVVAAIVLIPLIRRRRAAATAGGSHADPSDPDHLGLDPADSDLVHDHPAQTVTSSSTSTKGQHP
jgi:hypothetical protein